MNKAWHLRNDGKAFPVKVHLYCMQDEDLSSEAEVAAFLISTNSEDKDIAREVLEAWMALLIENEVSYDADNESILDTVEDSIKSLPYHFQYPLSDTQLLDICAKSKHFNDIDALYDFVDDVRERLPEIQDSICKSINQQFCRVRVGGQYNSVAGNNEIWFRISSVGFNWANTIYVFTSSIHRAYKLDNITICRDAESDYGYSGEYVEYFYKAKDGAVYKNMPIQEFLDEEHEHSLVFESTSISRGIISTMKSLLSQGTTYHDAVSYIRESVDLEESYSKSLWSKLVNQEKSRVCVAAPRTSSYKRRRINEQY